MNPKLHSSFLLVCAILSGSQVLGADAPVPKMPALHVDPSLVTEGRTPVVPSYADVVEPVEKTVVSIESSKTIHERLVANPLFRQLFGDVPDQEGERKEEGLGSGVIVSADGYILTNNHVIAGADELTVVLSDGREFPGKVIGADPKTDVAVVKIDQQNLPVITFADSDRLRVGDVVFAVGNPLGVGETVTMGIVSAKSRHVGILEDVAGYEDFIQTDAAINMGNSGGALVDAKGRLVGINSAIISPSRGNIGIGFAVPVNLAEGVMKSLIETGTVTRGYLGVATDPLTPDIAEQLGLPRTAKGVIVTETTPGSPAEKAGIKRSDIILSVDGKLVSSRDELRLRIAQMAPGSSVEIKVARDGKPVSVVVVLGKFAEKPNQLIEGVDVGRVTDEARRKFGIDSRVTGLVVTDVDSNSPYADDLPVGSVILEINRSPIEDLESARALLHPGRNLLLIYFHQVARYDVVTVK